MTEAWLLPSECVCIHMVNSTDAGIKNPNLKLYLRVRDKTEQTHPRKDCFQLLRPARPPGHSLSSAIHPHQGGVTSQDFKGLWN